MSNLSRAGNYLTKPVFGFWWAGLCVLGLCIVGLSVAANPGEFAYGRQDQDTERVRANENVTSGTEQEKGQTQEGSKTERSSVGREGKTQADEQKGKATDEDVQMFFNPNFSDAALPTRREEEWTPPPPIDWSIEGVMELNFDHLKFNIKPDETFEVRQLTLDLLKLRGRTIKIRGYIRPSFKEKNITRFVFVRDNQECCFGPGAALYDSMIVNMAPGHSVNFSTRPVTLEGRFKLSPLRGPDERVWSIFELNETVVR